MLLVSKYYQWNTATAGTGGTITNANATGSICPKGWKLPNSNSTAKGTFAYMLQQYGVQSKINVAAGAVNSPVNGNDYDIALSPPFFVRGGYINPDRADKFIVAGQRGWYWSSRAYSDTVYAYYLSFDYSYVTPSNISDHYIGQSLRCLISTP